MAEAWRPSVPKAGPFKTLDFEPMLGLSLPGSGGRAGPRTAQRQRFETIQAVSARIGRNVRGHAQVLVKITSKGYNHGQARAHINYITRHGKLTAEDELGFALDDKASVREKLNGWRLSADTIYLDSDRQRRLRQTLHFTLGMPAGTDPNKVLEGARRFARQEFEGHQYMMVLHEPASDPKPGAPEHPHVHIAVRALSETQRRLQVNPNDLLYFREALADSSAFSRSAATRWPSAGEKRDGWISSGGSPPMPCPIRSTDFVRVGWFPTSLCRLETRHRCSRSHGRITSP
jgi:hypothetical protein